MSRKDGAVSTGDTQLSAAFDRLDEVCDELRSVVAKHPGTSAAAKAGRTLKKLAAFRANKRRLSLTLWLAGLIVVGGALYRLSLGPFVWAANHGFVPTESPFWSTFYSPLMGILQLAPEPVDSVASWYYELWAGVSASPIGYGSPPPSYYSAGPPPSAGPEMVADECDPATEGPNEAGTVAAVPVYHAAKP